MPRPVPSTATSLLPRLSIRTWLLLLALAFVLPMGAILFRYLVIWEEQDSRAVAYAKIKIMADASVGQVELLLRDQEAALAVVATEFRGSPPTHSRYFHPKQFMELHPQFTNLTVHDVHLNTIYSYLPYPPATDAQRLFPWQREASRSDAFVVGDAVWGPLSGKWITVLTYPVRNAVGERSGFVSASIDLLWLSERLLGSVPKSTALAVVDRQGKFMWRSTDPGVWMGKAGPAAFKRVFEGRREGFATLVGVDGVERMVAFVTVPSTGWRVVAGVPEVEAMAAYRALRNQGLAIGLVLLLLVLMLAWRIASVISRPVRALAETSVRVAEGDTTARARLAGPTELEAVARQFNHMLDARTQVEAALRDSETRWRFALEGAGDGVWDWNVVTGAIFYSARCMEMLGYSEGDFPPALEAWFARVHPRDLPAISASIREHLDGRAPTFLKEYRMRCKDGSYKWIEIRGLVVERTLRGRPLRMVGTHTDITERRRMQQQQRIDQMAQRDALVREVHHRINNNLQGIIGILREFGRQHPEAAEPVSQVVGQVQSVAVIHGLQGRTSSGQVRLCELTLAVASGIDSLWSAAIAVDIPDPRNAILVAQDEAVPVALVLNELILNAVKHGAPSLGGVKVSMQDTDEPCTVRIDIVNGGRWQPSGEGAHAGLQLVETLMPRHGAKLLREVRGDCICTTLELSPPVLYLEGVEST